MRNNEQLVDFNDVFGISRCFSKNLDSETAGLAPVKSVSFALSNPGAVTDVDKNLALIIETERAPIVEGVGIKTAGAARRLAKTLAGIFSHDEKVKEAAIFNFINNRQAEEKTAADYEYNRKAINNLPPLYSSDGQGDIDLSYVFSKAANKMRYANLAELYQDSEEKTKKDIDVLKQSNDGIYVLFNNKSRTPSICITGPDVYLGVEKLFALGNVFPKGAEDSMAKGLSKVDMGVSLYSSAKIAIDETMLALEVAGIKTKRAAVQKLKM